MSEDNSPVPNSVLTRAGQLYTGFLAIALDGQRVNAAMEAAGVSRQTLSYWRKLYPDWIAAIQARAVADAMATRKELAVAIAAQRQKAQDSFDEYLLGHTQEIVERVMGVVTNGEDKDSLNAGKLLQEWLIKGWALPRLDDHRGGQDLPPMIQFDPHVENLQSILVPAGSEMTIRTPDPILDLDPQGSQKLDHQED